MNESKESAKILSGTELSEEICDTLTNRISDIKKSIPDFEPHLMIVQVGNREDSNVYIRNKIKAGSKIGVKCSHLRLPRTVTESELLPKIEQLNNDSSIHGIIVQLPLDTENEINVHKVSDAILPEKDVDGLHTINQGKLCVGNMTGIIPCTPSGILELIKRTGIIIEGSRVVVLGRSRIVGSPIAELLKWKDATVTICHIYSKNIIEHTITADILIVAIGQPEYIRGSWIKPGAVVIDCGINYISDLENPGAQRLVGDVNFEEAAKVAGYITPVPGGVGPATVAMLMKNTVSVAEKFELSNEM